MGADLSKQMVLPEDLGFLRADGSILLASISHEHDAWLELAASVSSEVEWAKKVLVHIRSA
jgi:hypothetical protein